MKRVTRKLKEQDRKGEEGDERGTEGEAVELGTKANAIVMKKKSVCDALPSKQVNPELCNDISVPIYAKVHEPKRHKLCKICICTI